MSESAKSSKASSPATSPEKPVPTDPAMLAAAVRTQVEYYFSKENLKNDTYLLSKMDSQNSVAISTILSFAKLKALTQDEEVVKDALKSSTSVSVVDDRLKSIAKPGRNTIILREIPPDTAEEDIREIFNYPGCKPITSVKSDIGDTWFVVMETEADAKDTVLDLKLKKRMFKGSPVKARLKSEAVVNRSSYPSSTAPAANNMYPVMYPFAAGARMDVQQQFGYGRQASPNADGNAPQGRGDHEGHGNQGKGGGRNEGNNHRENRSRGNGKRDNHNNNSSNHHHHNKGGEGRKHNSHNHSHRGKDKEGGQQQPQKAQVIEINTLNFPPLPPQGEDTSSGAGSSGQEDYSTIGYGDKPFIKYQIDDIVNIVKNIKEAVLPESIRLSEHPLAMEETPNKDLLLRQRTFSIDETREQMQLGRPVQRDAVIAGEVDYNSVMYGEDAPPQAPQNAPPAAQVPKKKTGGSWAGVLKSSAGSPAQQPTSKPEVPKKEPSKAKPSSTNAPTANTASTASTSGGKGKAEKKGGRGGGRHRNDQKDKEKAAEPPLKWGDKPSFANVLKAKEDGSSAQPATTTGSTATSGPTSNTRRPRGGSEGSDHKGKKHPSAEDGPWSKQKLPPLEKE